MLKKFFTLTLICLIALLSFGCGNKLSKFDENISELRTNIYAAESENAKVNAITGRRETPYILDGSSDKKVDYTVITVYPTNFQNGKKFSYKVELNGKTYEGEFLPHPFAESVSVDIPIRADMNVINLIVKSDGYEETFALNSVINENNLNSEKALDIAFNRLKNSLKEMEEKGKLDAEIYLRVTENPIDNTGGYFWYVAFVGKNQQTFAVLLNCETGEICAVRE